MDKVFSDPILSYLWSFIGKPYIWGGKGPIGFDCSGLVVEMLRAQSILDPKEDMTANDLFSRTIKGGINKPKAHALVFYGTRQRCTHVGYAISSEYMVEAGGGNSSCFDAESAARLGAMVRLSSIFQRKDYLGAHMYDKTMF